MVASLTVEHRIQGPWALAVATCGLPGSRAQAQQLWLMGLAASRHVASSQIRDQSCVSCLGLWTFYHWAPRDAALVSLFESIILENGSLKHRRPWTGQQPTTRQHPKGHSWCQDPVSGSMLGGLVSEPPSHVGRMEFICRSPGRGNLQGNEPCGDEGAKGPLPCEVPTKQETLSPLLGSFRQPWTLDLRPQRRLW